MQPFPVGNLLAEGKSPLALSLGDSLAMLRRFWRAARAGSVDVGDAKGHIVAMVRGHVPIFRIAPTKANLDRRRLARHGAPFVFLNHIRALVNIILDSKSLASSRQYPVDCGGKIGMVVLSANGGDHAASER